MAWTRSSPQRGTFANPLGFVSGQASDLTLNLLSAANGLDRVRISLCLAAATLAVSAVGLPYLETELLAVVFSSFAALLLLVAASPVKQAIAAPANDEPTLLGAQHHTQSAAPTPVFAPLLPAHRKTERQIDAAHWASLTSHMSHELRTPLNAVLGFSELMSREALGPMGSADYSGYAEAIHASGRTLLKSAEDALAITSLLADGNATTNAFSSTHLRDSFEAAVVFHGANFTADNIELDIRSTLDEQVFGDSQTVRQIFINVLSKLLRVAAARSTLVIEADSDADQVRVLLQVTREKPCHPAHTAQCFDLLMANTLAVLSGVTLTNAQTTPQSACVELVFLRAAQDDLFPLKPTNRHGSQSSALSRR